MSTKPCTCAETRTRGAMPTAAAYSGGRSGLAMSGCKKHPKCTDYLIYKTEPSAVLNDSAQHAHMPLNRQFGLNMSPMYQPRVNLDDGSLVYSINNEKLLDARRWGQTYLDRPPFDSKISAEQIYDDQFSRGRVGFYDDYSQIRGGNLKYYVDANIAPPYITPTFVLPGSVNYELYTDPMGTVRPQYPRNMLNGTNYNVSSYQTIRDEQMQREDILSRKMQTENQRRYDSRWFS